jgi:hypothetical protein
VLVVVHPQDPEAINLPEASRLTTCRVVDVVLPAVRREDEDAVAGGIQREDLIMPEDVLELSFGDPVVESEEVQVVLPAVVAVV